MISRFVKELVMTVPGKAFPLMRLISLLTILCALLGLLLIYWMVSRCACRNLLTRSGCWSMNSLRTTTLVVTNFPSGQSVRSSRKSCPFPSTSKRVPQGSATHAPSILPSLNRVRILAGSVGTIFTMPPFSARAQPHFGGEDPHKTTPPPPTRGGGNFFLATPPAAL